MAREVTSDSLVLRPANLADGELLLAWRNDAETRAASVDSAKVEPAGHRKWLAGSLASGDRCLMIAEVVGKPIGTVRADRCGDGWELSWTVAPDARGLGYGARMICQFAALLAGTLSARIKPDNRASIRIAEATGFVAVGASTGGDLLRFVRAPDRGAPRS